MLRKIVLSSLVIKLNNKYELNGYMCCQFKYDSSILCCFIFIS